MYNTSSPNLDRVTEESWLGTNMTRQIIDCPAGWSYNRTDLSSTVVSEYNWVCDRNGYLTLLYTICAIGGLIGNFVFGPLAEK